MNVMWAETKAANLHTASQTKIIHFERARERECESSWKQQNTKKESRTYLVADKLDRFV